MPFNLCRWRMLGNRSSATAIGAFCRCPRQSGVRGRRSRPSRQSEARAACAHGREMPEGACKLSRAMKQLAGQSVLTDDGAKEVPSLRNQALCRAPSPLRQPASYPAMRPKGRPVNGVLAPGVPARSTDGMARQDRTELTLPQASRPRTCRSRSFDWTPSFGPACVGDCGLARVVDGWGLSSSATLQASMLSILR